MSIRVKDQHRTNPLSLKPGGQEVTIIYENGQSFIYDKVKNPGLYVKRISKTGAEHGRMIEILVDVTSVWNSRLNTDPWEF